MRTLLCLMTAALLFAGAAHAQLAPVQKREPRPGSSALAATMNVVFVPLRLAYTTVGAGLGGLTGWLTAGNTHAARDVWGLFDGQGYLQPEMMYGAEAVQIGELEFQMHLTKP